MYHDHVPTIAAAMVSDVRAFQRGALFALVSIRKQFNLVPDAHREVLAIGEKSKVLFGFKAAAYRYIMANGDAMQTAACAFNTDRALWEITRCPGLGIVKGAFILQMMGHNTACLDSRNVAREGLKPRAWRSDGERHKISQAFKRKIDRYLEATRGRAAEYWNMWCHDAGAQYGFSGQQVSEMHLTSIVPRAQRTYAANAAAIPF